jgi:hypothetical protein
VINPTNKTGSSDTKQLIDQLLLGWSWLENYVNVERSRDVDPFGPRRELLSNAELTAEAWAKWPLSYVEEPKG